MADDMVERVARAIYVEFENRPIYAQGQMNNIVAMELARAAIEAMREPGESGSDYEAMSVWKDASNAR